MDILIPVLNFLKMKMETPVSYGWFHILNWLIVIGFTVFLCIRHRRPDEKAVSRVVFGVALVVTLLEIYKQTVYTFSAGEGSITADYQWYAFPWQFCSSPMYAGLLTGIFRKGKIHDALYAYLATYALFAGLCVMFYPADVFIDLIGINIQTMVCHGSMVVIGIWLLMSGKVKLAHKTILKAVCVFAGFIAVAIFLNELTWRLDLTGGETFNMFFISPHWEGTLPVYSMVQQVVPYPWCLVIYISAFTAAAYIMLLLGMLANKAIKGNSGRGRALEHSAV